MSANVINFEFRTNNAASPLHTVRVVPLEGAPWFVAADVCKALQLTNPTVACAALDPADKAKKNLGSGSDANMVSESGLYALIMRAHRSNPEARAFQDWVTKEVLPSIRKTGGYVLKGTDRATVAEGTTETLPLPKTFADALRGYAETLLKLAESEDDKARLSAQVARLETKAAVVDTVFADGKLTNITRLGRAFANLNTMKLKKDLMRAGYLYVNGNSYRVYSKWRDSHFVEKADETYGTFQIFATDKGLELLSRLYQEGALTLKKSAA